MIRPMRPSLTLIAIVLVVLFLSAQWVSAQTIDRTTLTNKVIAGYQGWHACPGDGNAPSCGWGHWSESSANIGPGYYHCDLWPDTAEYDASDLYFVPNTTLVQGGTPYLYSARKPGAVDTHFRWMQENGIDGVFLQRFTCELEGGDNQNFRDHVLQNVMDSATTYGRVFAVEYDISGQSESTVYSKLTSDWTYLKNTFNIKNHPRYQYHNGKPVVVIWGLGVVDRPGTPAIAQQVSAWFKADGCFVMVGVGNGWRTLTSDVKTEAAWLDAYHSFDGITPWSVGRYHDSAEISAYKSTAQADLNDCNSRGILYMTTAWPRFAWNNMHHYPCGQSYTSPRGGQHLWDQFYAFKSINVPCQFVANFDEYDESTAIMKSSDNYPVTDCWLGNEGLGNDFYLRLTNQGSRMQKGLIPLSQTMPISASNSPDNAQMISNTIPTSMIAGHNYIVTVTVSNIGETTWNAKAFKLGAVGGSDPFYAATRVTMSQGDVVTPNEQKVFSFTMTAPQVSGTYTTDWQMVHESVRWFGGVLTKQIQVTSDSGDTVPPGPLTGFAATRGDSRVVLTWSNPSDVDFAGTIVRYKTTGFPTGPSDGTQVCDRAAMPNTNDSFNHAGLTNGVPVYYAAFAYDYARNYSTALTAHATPLDLAPGAVQNFTATPGDGRVSLSWHNPADSDFTGVMIRVQTTGYPSSASDGALVVDKSNTPGSNDSYTHTGLANGTTYYYRAFAHDAIPNHAAGATAGATPAAPVTFSNSAFISAVDGWVTLPWSADPNRNPGTMAWASSGGNPSGCMQSTGSGVTDSNSKCLREGGEISKTISTSGYAGIRVYYDLKVNSLGGAYTGAGTDLCSVDHGVIDEQLTVFYSTNGGASWAEAEYLRRNALLASYQSFGTRTVDLTSVTGCNNNVGFGLRFRWQFNTDTDTGWLDNIRVEGTQFSPDTTPPGPVTGLATTAGNRRNRLHWTNPADADFAGTKVLFKTTGYPSGPADGMVVYDGMGTDCIQTGLTNGVSCYYAAFAYDGVPNYSSSATASATPLYFDPAQAKLQTDDTDVVLTEGIVSAVWSNDLYAQCWDKPVGLHVKRSGHGVQLGEAIWAKGKMRTDASLERYLDADWVLGYDGGIISPLGLGNASLGGGNWNYVSPSTAGQRGLSNPGGPNNIGVLVLVWGRVTQRDTVNKAWFYIDDGASVKDGTQTEVSPGVLVDSVGVRVSADPTLFPSGAYVVVTGVSSCFSDSGALKRLILPRPGEIRILSP